MSFVMGFLSGMSFVVIVLIVANSNYTPTESAYTVKPIESCRDYSGYQARQWIRKTDKGPEVICEWVKTKES